MTWNLFIDDERYPVDEPGMSWEIARNWDDVCYLISVKGFPRYISFDHDLGDNEKTGYDIVKLLVEGLMDGRYEIPQDFNYYVHSQNPVGKANIEGYIDGYIKAKERSEQVPLNQCRFDEIVAIAEQDYGGDISVGKVKNERL